MKRIISGMLIVALFFLQVVSFSSCKASENKYTEYYFDYFDTATTIVGYTKTEEEFNSVCEEIKTLLNEYHRLFNIYNRYEGLNNLVTVNDLKGGTHQEVEVDKKIIEMLTYAKEMYTKTDGRVNVAMGSVLSIWHAYRKSGLDTPENAELPPMEKLKEAEKHTDINDIIIDEEKNTVFLADPLMTLDVGAVAKGYTVEKVCRYLEEKGVSGFLLNVGGNVRTVGEASDGEPWKVGIENPDILSDTAYIEFLALSGQSVVTSGSYQRFYTVNGKNYHHIIDPDTLMPGDKYMSVSVVTDDSGLGDAFSTALFLMDYEKGLKLVEEIDGVEAMWVMPDGEQKYSSGFEDYTFEYEMK